MYVTRVFFFLFWPIRKEKSAWPIPVLVCPFRCWSTWLSRRKWLACAAGREWKASPGECRDGQGPAGPPCPQPAKTTGGRRSGSACCPPEPRPAGRNSGFDSVRPAAAGSSPAVAVGGDRPADGADGPSAIRWLFAAAAVVVANSRPSAPLRRMWRGQSGTFALNCSEKEM